jgi:glycosyltransferase involved in cell wall biosynthesis
MSGRTISVSEEKLRIAIMGIRGVPARFGGSETAVEAIGARLARRGHQVTVYCRGHNDTIPGVSFYKGMNRIVLPSLNTLNLDLMSHSLLSLMQMSRERFDVVHFHGVGNALVLPLFKLTGRGAKSLLVVDGPDWKRPKWGRLARLAFRASLPMAVRLADEIISDNIEAQKLFRERYGRETSLVGYGANLEMPSTQGALEKYGLVPNGYILQVAAIVPDKGVHVLVQAYEKVETDLPLVIAGDTPYMTDYKSKVQSTRDPRIRFLGYVYGLGYHELVANCRMYIHPLIVDGTSPALLQAMAYGRCVVASDLPEIEGSLADTGVRCKAGDPDALGEQVAALLACPDKIEEYGRQARQRAVSHFSWDQVTDEYERLSVQLVKRLDN